MSLQIIGMERSNFVRTVRMVAHEKGIPYEHVPELPHSDAVKALHPFGQIPAIRHDDFTLIESLAITRYLDTVFAGPALIPADPREAAIVNQWSAMVATTVDQILMRRYVVEYLFHKDNDGNVVRTEIDKAVKRFRRVFDTLSDAVGAGYLGGKEFSMADCFFAPILAVVQLFPEAKEHVDARAPLGAYFERIGARDSFTATAPTR